MVHTEVLAGLQSLRELQSLSRHDGESSDTDEGLVVYDRAHTNPCPAVPHVTDAAQQALTAGVARTAHNEETARQAEAAQQLARDEADTELKAKADKRQKQRPACRHLQPPKRPKSQQTPLSSWQKIPLSNDMPQLPKLSPGPKTRSQSQRPYVS
jgi:hypothetical protein